MVSSDPFAIACDVSSFCARRNYDPVSQDLVLRSLNQLEAFGGSQCIIQALVRECGLFPYFDYRDAATQDLFAVALHRLPSLGEGFVLHREQRTILDILLSGRSVVLSAPTSFGKSVLIDAMIAEGNYSNILILVPTIALMDEARRRITVRFSPGYKVITHLSQDKADRNIFVLTPERANLDRIGELDLFIVDEFYKLGLSEDKDRHATLNKLCYRLLKTRKQFFMLGPNIEGIPEQLSDRCEFRKSEYKTVAANVTVLDGDPVEDTVRLCKKLGDSTIVFCRSPGRVVEVANRLIEAGISSSNEQARLAAEWSGINYHQEWHYARAAANGIGVHHGSIPRSLAHWSVKAFNEGWLNFLLCTTTLIEGVNTRAENLIIVDSKVNRRPIDFFTFNNIKGRAGRMMKHFVGNVFSFSDAPQNDLPFVDFQFFTQPESTSSSILLELDDEDMSAGSREKVSQFRNNNLLSWETLRQSGLDPLQQLKAAEVIDARPRYWADQFDFTMYPEYEQIKAISALMWDCFSGSRIAQGAVVSSVQLTVLIYNLRTSSVKQIIDNFIEYGGTPDEGVQKATNFVRNWAMFHYPRLLIALNNIAREVLSHHGLTVSDVSGYAQQVENLFHDSGVAALDEYGVPLPLAFRLQSRLAAGNSLDGTLALLKTLDIDALKLHKFERELLEDAKLSLR
jgi:rhodanese-related sulfurtransferase